MHAEKGDESCTRLQNLLEFVCIEHLAGIKDDEVCSLLTYDTFDVFRTDSAEHLWLST